MRNLFRNVNPAVLIIIALLLGNNMLNSNQSLSEWLFDQVLIMPAILVGLTFHEAAHGFASYWLGDPTPKLQGRLTLNPVAHLDPMGTVLIILVGFGWGKPVMYNPNNLYKLKSKRLMNIMLHLFVRRLLNLFYRILPMRILCCVKLAERLVILKDNRI